ncbi:MAG: glutathione S-transferase family protein [Chromatiales bacterium]|nr:glutathione S-transferase family protein [Chromatiales bacterium]
MQLYDMTLSGNCYKIRLLLALLDIAHERIPVDLRAGEARTPRMLALNPRGQLPILVDGDDVIWDSQAILVYLARRYGGEQWLPTDAAGMAQVMQWLAVAENELLYGLARARRMLRMNGSGDLAEAQAWGREALAVMDARLTQRDWLAAGHPTIADLACYPYVSLAPEGDVTLETYPAVMQWMARIEALPGYVAFDA